MPALNRHRLQIYYFIFSTFTSSPIFYLIIFPSFTLLTFLHHLLHLYISKYITRSIHSINIKTFNHDIMSSSLITHPPTSLSYLADCYNCTLVTLQNKHAPVKSKILHPKPTNNWFTPALNKLKLTKLQLERVWSKSYSIENLASVYVAYCLKSLSCCYH
jgi:hypothetical protein